MSKIIVLLILSVTFFDAQSCSQSSSNFLNGYIVSLKCGYHTEDKVNSFDHIPGGFSADGTLEYHTGKNWYVGVNADLSFGSDIYLNEKRNIVVFSYLPVVKYRFFLTNASVNIGAGFGASSFTVNGFTEDKTLNLNLRAGMDFQLNKKLLASFEAVYNEMMEVSMDGSRSNRIAMIKIGLSYLISKSN